MRRLSDREYRNTIADLFPGVVIPALLPLPDVRVDGFLNQVDGHAASTLAVQRLEHNAAVVAGAVAAAVAQSQAPWVSCDLAQDACADAMVADVVARAFRRPPTAEELGRQRAFFAAARAEFGVSEGLEVFVTALLESPWFLYRPELSAGDAAAGRVPLSDHERAARLSYFFLESMPDAALFEAAARGELSTAVGYNQQVERLLREPRARAAITRFFTEWLRLDKLDRLGLDAATFPEADDALRRDLAASLVAFIDDAVWQQDSFAALYAGSHGFVNDRLAPIFGVPPPGSDALVRVELDPTQRRGVLTQPGALAATSHGISHSPIYRGVDVLRGVLCTPVPAPPPGILDQVNSDANAEMCTTRERVAQGHSSGDCQGCHRAIDGAGFVFEHYDALGRYRTQDNGCAVDASGSFPTVNGLPPVQNAVEFAGHLAESQVAATCLGAHLLRYGIGRQETVDEGCLTERLAADMLSEGGSLLGLVRALVQSDVFLTRPGQGS